MKIIKTLPSDNITVRYDSGSFQGRTPTNLSFADDYVPALRCALDAIRAGKKNVYIVQFRETLHSHTELVAALGHIHAYSTDEEIIEQVHHASRPQEQHGLINLLRSVVTTRPLVWANL